MSEIITQTEYCVISECAGLKAQYAKTELEKYIYLLTGCAAGSRQNGSGITFTLHIDPKKEMLGTEGYEIHTADGGHALAISAFDEQGLLYGVYGLLDEHYGVGFYFSGDAIPQNKSPLPLLTIDERRIPEQYIRGILPWTNFPQSATSYSIQDWLFIIDQMTRMRMNFINIHNYNGELGHNEVFHNIMLNGEASRNWNATASKPHAWGMKGWNVNEYLFGGSELFDDYDFGADATLHNDCLGNIDVFKKGSSEFAVILSYAHKRGVKIGLGLDLNLITSDYSGSADNAAIAQARIDQIIADYPTLDYLLLYRSENSPNFDIWNSAFQHTYHAVKERAANIRIAVSGWGLDPDTIIGLPRDVIAAPISGHGVNDKFPDGSIYGEREFWACPWSERDYNDSVHFAPYNTRLSQTIGCYQNRSKNTKGLMTLTWRISDAVDAKLSYIAEAPWDSENRLDSSEAAYRRYAERCYGSAATERVTGIINENEAYATNASECLFTPKPSNSDRSADISKAEKQLAIIDSAIAASPDPAWTERLKRLRCRILAVKSFCRLDQGIAQMGLAELTEEFSTFVHCFTDRIDDISTLGNLFSIENRYVQEWYLPRAEELRKKGEVPANIPASTDGLHVLSISPVTALCGTNFADFKAIVLHSAAPERLSVSLFWRKAGGTWNKLPMERRVKGIFGLRIPTADFPEGVIEYYIEAAANGNTARYPVTAPALCAAISVTGRSSGERDTVSAAPRLSACENGRLRWTPCDGDILWYRIYRGTEPGFAVGPQSLVTYVHRDTLTYRDCAPGFDGNWLDGEYYYKVSCLDGALTESAPSEPAHCRMNPPCITTLEGTVEAKPMLLSLGQFHWGTEITHLCVNYGATGSIRAELWMNGPPESNGSLLGSALFCSTGITAVQEVSEIPLLQPLTESRELFLLITPTSNTQWQVYSFYPSQGALREAVITTNADSFAIGPERKSIRLFAEENAGWSVKALDGSPAGKIRIDKSGLLEAEQPQTVRAISHSRKGLIRERLITASVPVREAPPCAFEDFWLLSELIGCDEAVEVGGLVNGYEYICQVREDKAVIYEPKRSAGGSFHIPATVLKPGSRYEISVTASDSKGDQKEISHSFETSAEGLMPLNQTLLLGVNAPSGECTYVDEWNVCTQGRYEVIPEGLRLTTRPGDSSTRFCFRLPQPYTPELPHLLIKAAALRGDWTIQINLIPIVGPRVNDIALRKDLRTFGFEPGTPIDLTLMISTARADETAESIFKSIQLLPDRK